MEEDYICVNLKASLLKSAKLGTLLGVLPQLARRDGCRPGSLSLLLGTCPCEPGAQGCPGAWTKAQEPVVRPTPQSCCLLGAVKGPCQHCTGNSYKVGPCGLSILTRPKGNFLLRLVYFWCPCPHLLAPGNTILCWPFLALLDLASGQLKGNKSIRKTPPPSSFQGPAFKKAAYFATKYFIPHRPCKWLPGI